MSKKKTLKQHCCEEIEAELAMRRRVWERIPGRKEEFTSLTHQKRYDIMRSILATIEALPDRAFREPAAEVDPNKNQTSLFS